MLVVRRATRDDLPRAAALAGELVRQHHAVDPGRFMLVDGVEAGYERWFRHELDREQARILVAELHGEIVGYTYGTLEARDWNLLLDEHGAIHDVLVAEPARRGGAGRRLVEALIAELEALGAQRIVLSTMVGNHAAQRLFTACGFRPTLLEMTRNRATDPR